MTPPDTLSVAPREITIAVAPAQAGQRLDRVIAESETDLSRSRVKALIEQGRLRRDAGPTIRTASHRVKPGERYVLEVPAPAPAVPEAQAMALNIVFEDEHLLVVDKPAGLVVHPAPGNPDRTLVNALLAHCGASLTGIGGVQRPGIVHRLDKDTSGLMVVAKTQAAHAELVRQLAAREVTRIYRAIAWGVPDPPAADVVGNIGRSLRDRKRMAVLRSGGRAALTAYRTLARFGAIACLLECRLATGRTHQIRVHLAHLGHAIVGDRTYGPRRPLALPTELQESVATLGRQALHAVTLAFRHPVTSSALSFTSPLPGDMEMTMSALKSAAKLAADGSPARRPTKR